MSSISNSTATQCYHCGELCDDAVYHFDQKDFCCHGCQLVYEVLAEKDMVGYYQLESFPGASQKSTSTFSNKFDYLDDEETEANLLDFKNESESHVTFLIPLIHCASCIWLLENLFHLNASILSSRVDFIKKKVHIRFSNSELSLKSLVTLLATIGYEPSIHLGNLDETKSRKVDRKTVKKLAVAGFCFGNMMLFSVPEYFSETALIAENFRGLFNYLNILLALPVVFYAASDYYTSAWNSLRQKRINMDVPIVLGIFALFFYSLWEVLTLGNAGYMDSLGGLLFFLLLGKVYQEKTFATLEFDRDYRSYFPIAVTRLQQSSEEVIPLRKLEIGNRILVRDEELIPADSVLLSASALIDYSFVTGEEVPVPKRKGEHIYAGGRQIGEAIELAVVKSPSQGYLTDLWNNESFEKEKTGQLVPLSNKISGIFTWTVLLVAFGSFVIWAMTDLSMGVKVFASVLIVACPCALAMSTPFTLGNTLRIFGRSKLYLKNGAVIERLAEVNTIVFDKTGTLTDPSQAKVEYHGIPLTKETLQILHAMVSRSTHPLSNRIHQWLGKRPPLVLDEAREIKGAGIRALYHGQEILLGSKDFAGSVGMPVFSTGNQVYLSIGGSCVGIFHVQSGLRDQATDLITQLGDVYDLHLISGDHPHEYESLQASLGRKMKYNFLQSPKDKLAYVKQLNQEGKSTLMVGDGLNDAGALREGTVGVAVTDQVSHFSPASDAIISADSMWKMPGFLDFAKSSRKIIKASFVLSLLYNVIGLSLAIQGILSPVICAVLMPLSSISVVVFTTLATNFVAWKKGLLAPNTT